MIKLFFATDIRGSSVCFRKFLDALPTYGVDVGILFGDLTGKVLVPLVKTSASSWECTLMSRHVDIETKDELSRVKKTIEQAGYYWVEQARDEYEATRSDPLKSEPLFKGLVLERARQWLDLADERLDGAPYEMYMAPGNDDWFEIDDLIEATTRVRACDMRGVDLGGHEMVTCSWSGPTPWDTPRETDDGELTAKLEELCGLVTRQETAIYNFHVPPYDTTLDLGPKLDENLVAAAGETAHVGSGGVRRMIEEHQPLLGLHGQVIESRATERLGRTLCVNPGSDYAEGVLRGAQVVLGTTRVETCELTAG